MFEALGIIPSTAKTNKLGTILVPSLQELPTNFKIRTEQKPRANKKGGKKKRQSMPEVFLPADKQNCYSTYENCFSKNQSYMMNSWSTEP
jgi:hypothetical protein